MKKKIYLLSINNDVKEKFNININDINKAIEEFKFDLTFNLDDQFVNNYNNYKSQIDNLENEIKELYQKINEGYKEFIKDTNNKYLEVGMNDKLIDLNILDDLIYEKVNKDTIKNIENEINTNSMLYAKKIVPIKYANDYLAEYSKKSLSSFSINSYCFGFISLYDYLNKLIESIKKLKETDTQTYNYLNSDFYNVKLEIEKNRLLL